jgi:hypothetical protein
VTPKWPETGFHEINGDFLEADFGPIAKNPTVRPTPSAGDLRYIQGWWEPLMATVTFASSSNWSS